MSVSILAKVNCDGCDEEFGEVELGYLVNMCEEVWGSRNVAKQLRTGGWITERKGYTEKHFCPNCQEKDDEEI